VILDTQSIHAVDVCGLVVDCVVLPASAHENTAGIALLDGVAAQCDTVTKALVDQGFKNSARVGSRSGAGEEFRGDGVAAPGAVDHHPVSLAMRQSMMRWPRVSREPSSWSQVDVQPTVSASSITMSMSAGAVTRTVRRAAGQRRAALTVQGALTGSSRDE